MILNQTKFITALDQLILIGEVYRVSQGAAASAKIGHYWHDVLSI